MSISLSLSLLHFDATHLFGWPTLACTPMLDALWCLGTCFFAAAGPCSWSLAYLGHTWEPCAWCAALVPSRAIPRSWLREEPVIQKSGDFFKVWRNPYLSLSFLVFCYICPLFFSFPCSAWNCGKPCLGVPKPWYAMLFCWWEPSTPSKLKSRTTRICCFALRTLARFSS